MTMSLDDVLKSEIPEGPYRLAMEEIKVLLNHSYLDVEFAASLLAAFEALLKLVRWEEDTSDLTVAHMVGHSEGRKVGRKETLAEVRKVVEEMKVEMIEPTTHKWGSENEAPKYDSDTLTELLRRLDEMEAKG